MSPTSMQEQVQDFAASGFPVHKGTRIIAREPSLDSTSQLGSDLWFSRWCHNVFTNYSLISRCLGVRFLHDACKGLPAFVVGVGPSLDECITELKAAKNRAVIVSTDAALRALLANGITPDAVVSFDCKEDQERLWQDLPFPIKIPGIFNSCAHRRSILSWPGPILFYNQYHTQDELCKRILPDVLPELGQIPSAGTVGNMAVLFAHLLGCDPIGCVGMDFCYKETGDGWRYRARDWKYKGGMWVPDEIKELYDNEERLSRSVMVIGDDGHDYKTDPELKHYLESFRELMPHFKVPVVNCSRGGLLPASYPAMSVQTAVETYCKMEWQGGRTVLAHLAKIAPDPRKP